MDPPLFYFYFCFVVDVRVRLRKDLSRPSRVYLFFAKEKGGERKKKKEKRRQRRLRYSGEVAAARDDKKESRCSPFGNSNIHGSPSSGLENVLSRSLIVPDNKLNFILVFLCRYFFFFYFIEEIRSSNKII